MKLSILTTAFALPLLALTLPAGAQSVTITGGNGGTIQRDRDCTRASGTANCTVSSTGTSASGQTATKERARTTSAGSSSTTVTRTGPAGESTSRNRQVTVTR